MPAPSVYGEDGYVNPVSARQHFTQQFDLQDPEGAMNSYQKLMHQHTKQQFEIATASSRRRSNNHTERSSMSSETSNASISSAAS